MDSQDRLLSLYEALPTLIYFGRWNEATRVARRLLRTDSDKRRAALHAAGALIDAGAELGRSKQITDGIRAIESALPALTSTELKQAHYNIGNGYLALGQRQRGSGPATRAALGEAVDHLDRGIHFGASVEARINLANALSHQGRYVEALDEQNQVLEEQPLKHEAHANRGLTLWNIRRWMVPHQGLMEVARSDLARAVTLSEGDDVFQDRYRQALDQLSDVDLGTTPSPGRSSKVQRWIWQHGLNLNQCPFCRIETPNAFDTYALPNLLVGGRRRPSASEVYDMVNSLHRGYSTARWVLLQAMGIAGRVPRDHVATVQGSESAEHDLRTGLLLDAASGFYGVLNQVAACLNAYFHLNHGHLEISLARIWWPRGKRGRGNVQIPLVRRDLHPRFQRHPSVMLSALYRLSLSMERNGGRYWNLRKLRNDIQHHAIVVDRKLKTSSYFVASNAGEIADDVLKLGRVAKAALLYFGGAVWSEESRRMKRAASRAIVLESSSSVKRL